MGLHSKPNALDQLVHTLLTGLMLASAGLTVAEIAAPRSVLLALARACVVMAQGTWFWNVGAIMFTGVGLHHGVVCCSWVATCCARHTCKTAAGLHSSE